MSGAVDSWPALSFLEGLRPGPDESVELALLASYSADLGSIGATLLALAGKDIFGAWLQSNGLTRIRRVTEAFPL